MIVLAALIKKRRETAFRVTEMEREIETVRADLVHIDAVIQLFAPDVSPEDIPPQTRKPRQLAYFSHGEITRRALSNRPRRVCLATSERPLGAPPDADLFERSLMRQVVSCIVIRRQNSLRVRRSLSKDRNGVAAVLTYGFAGRLIYGFAIFHASLRAGRRT